MTDLPTGDLPKGEAFSAHVGTDFRVAGPAEQELVLRLVDVRLLGHQTGAPRPDPFALDFVGPAEPALDQRIHRLEHAQLGVLEIFLVAIGIDAAGGLRYEAVFN